MFTSFTQAAIAVGQAIRKELWQLVKDNFDDHEARLQTFEGAAKKIVVFDGLVKNASSASTLTGLTCWRAPSDFTLIDARISIFEKGSLTGTLEINVRKATSNDDTGAVSVFTTRPSIDVTAGASYDESSNAVFDNSNKEVSEGDRLFLDVTSLPSPVIGKFKIYLIGEV